jgi:hypothetical protein
LGAFFCRPTNLVGCAVFVAAIIRLFSEAGPAVRLDETTLLYFVAAAGLFLATNAKSLKFGDFSVELEELKEEVKEAKLLASIAQDSPKILVAQENPLAASAALDALAAAPAMDAKPGSAPDDPWKNVFGGKSVDKARGRLVSANVEPLKFFPGWYSLELRVESMRGAPPLEGEVRFFLHDSFPNNKPWVRAADGIATLHLKTWGAFTVGVLAEGGATRLELDLANLSTAPTDFRSR